MATIETFDSAPTAQLSQEAITSRKTKAREVGRSTKQSTAQTNKTQKQPRPLPPASIGPSSILEENPPGMSWRQDLQDCNRCRPNAEDH